MVAKDGAFDVMRELRESSACEIKDWNKTEKILQQLISGSIANARSQIAGRKTGTMTFDEAMRLVRRDAKLTRPSWGILRCIKREDGFPGRVGDYILDNYDGAAGGSGRPYEPTDDDRAATDWMFYQAPDENWVELDFEEE